MTISWTIKHFNELNTSELYDIMQLRLEVFSVEQNCAYQDADGKDFYAHHIMGCNDEGKLMAYSRILPAGISFVEISIGRVITSTKARKTGSGKELMQKSLDFIQSHYGTVPVRIGAQCYLTRFYSGFGFAIASPEYLEDNIPHVEMLRL